MNLASHHLQLAIMQPQIAPNTGNIARLCVATGTPLHLVRPMGFVLSDRQLKRSAMDYWPRLKLTVHDDTGTFLRSIGNTPCWFFDSSGQVDLWSADFRNGDCLIFGNETSGVPKLVMQSHPDRVVRIPQVEGERCLNLATAAGIALYEALRRVQQK